MYIIMASIDRANETNTKPLCKFYITIYKRMIRWFGYTYPYWLCDMDQNELLTCILRLVVTKNMYTIFINVSIRIRKNNGRDTHILEKYKQDNPDHHKRIKRQQYYDENVERIKQYNKMYHLLRTSRINIFKKSLT